MVALAVWPTDAADGSVANEARWRKMGRLWAPSAVQLAGSSMTPTYAAPNLTIQAGSCWVDGHYCELASSTVLTVTAAGGIAVVRFDPVANTAELVFRDGVFTPSRSLTGTWELVVASVSAGGVLTDARALLGQAGTPVYANSTARDLALPAPLRGDRAFTFDDGIERFYYGATTGWREKWGDRWGLVARCEINLDTGAISAGSTINMVPATLTYTALANRRYRYEMMIPRVLQVTSAGELVLFLTNTSNVSVGIGTRWQKYLNIANETDTAWFVGHETGISGATSRRIRGTDTGGTGTVSGAGYPGFLAVYDDGPTGSPPAA